ncbi:MAG: diacylglycerol/lipid kinase family protein [Phycisphaerales bacterium]
MRVAILANPASGRGRALRLARELREAVLFAGHEVEERSARDPESAQTIARADVAVIVGGDGTVHHQLGAFAACDAAIWHAPTGTENLFAREFGMTTGADDLLAALAADQTARVDLASINDRYFAIMAGVGPDASIVARVAAARTGPISKLSYAWPSTLEALRPNLPKMTIEIDGERLVDDQPGFVVIANSRHYGGRLNPARDAIVDDGLLDVVFFPCRSRVRALSWTLGCRLGRQGKSAYLFSRRVRNLRLTIDPMHRAMLQVDGEFAGNASGGMDVRVHPAALRVLRPAGLAGRQGRSKASASPAVSSTPPSEIEDSPSIAAPSPSRSV